LQNIMRSVWPGYPGPISPAAIEVQAQYMLCDMAGRIVTAGLSLEAALKETHARIEEVYKIRGGKERQAPTHGHRRPDPTRAGARGPPGDRGPAPTRGRLASGLSVRAADGGHGAGARRVPVLLRRVPEPDAEVRRHASGLRRLRELRAACLRRLLPPRGLELVHLHLRLGRLQARPRHGDGARADLAHPLPPSLHPPLADPLARADGPLGAELPLDLRREPRRPELSPGAALPHPAAGCWLAQRGRHCDGVRHLRQRVARLSVLRHLIPRRTEGHPRRALRGGGGRRRQHCAALPSRDVAIPSQHHHHRHAAVDDLDIQRLRDRLYPHQGRSRRRDPGASGLHVRDGLRRAADRRGHRGRALHAAGARHGDHRAVAVHAPEPREVSREAIDRFQCAVAYLFLGLLLLFVLFPFYWMTVTSFKTEDQMRSLVSMFWPSPFVVENYTQLLTKTDFAIWYRNSAFVAVSSTFVVIAVGTIGAYALALLRWGACASWAAPSCRARP